MILEVVFEGPGTAASNQYLLEIILILFGAFLLGYLFRHLLNDRHKREARRLQTELGLAQANDRTAELQERYELELNTKEERIDQLNTALSNAIADKVRLQQRVDQMQQSQAATPSAKHEPPKVEPKAPAVPPTPPEIQKPDELTEIEGVGPKMAGVLKELGYTSFRLLSEADPDRIRTQLKAKNPTFAVHDPTTWPEQAKLALNGDWERLKNWQKELKGGRRRR